MLLSCLSAIVRNGFAFDEIVLRDRTKLKIQTKICTESNNGTYILLASVDTNPSRCKVNLGFQIVNFEQNS